jgi:uncharacterized membrane protein
MILEFGLFFVGILGLLVFYIALAHLSERMGEGMGAPKYYLLYYLAVIALIMTVPAGWQIHYISSTTSEDALFALLVIGNSIVLAASYKYWWWLKDELLK